MPNIKQIFFGLPISFAIFVSLLWAFNENKEQTPYEPIKMPAKEEVNSPIVLHRTNDNGDAKRAKRLLRQKHNINTKIKKLNGDYVVLPANPHRVKGKKSLSRLLKIAHDLGLNPQLLTINHVNRL